MQRRVKMDGQLLCTPCSVHEHNIFVCLRTTRSELTKKNFIEAESLWGAGLLVCAMSCDNSTGNKIPQLYRTARSAPRTGVSQPTYIGVACVEADDYGWSFASGKVLFQMLWTQLTMTNDNECACMKSVRRHTMLQHLCIWFPTHTNLFSVCCVLCTVSDGRRYCAPRYHLKQCKKSFKQFRKRRPQIFCTELSDLRKSSRC